MEKVEKCFDFAINARFWFAKASPIEKREILSTVGSDFFLKDKTLYMDVQKPYCWLVDVVKDVPSASQRFGTDKQPIVIAQLEASWSQSPTVLRAMDEVRTFYLKY